MAGLFQGKYTVEDGMIKNKVLGLTCPPKTGPVIMLEWGSKKSISDQPLNSPSFVNLSASPILLAMLIKRAQDNICKMGDWSILTCPPKTGPLIKLE